MASLVVWLTAIAGDSLRVAAAIDAATIVPAVV
jgi:hypothetical protein